MPALTKLLTPINRGIFNGLVVRFNHGIYYRNINDKGNFGKLCEELQKGNFASKKLQEDGLLSQAARPRHEITNFYLDPKKSALNLSFAGYNLDGNQALELIKLAKNPKIQTIDFSRNNIGDDAIKEIAPILAKNNNLQGINFSYNNISDRAIDHIASMIEKNITLEEIFLNNELISEGGYKKILPYCEKNSAILSIDAISEIPSAPIYCQRFIDTVIDRNILIRKALDFYTSILGARIFRTINYQGLNVDDSFIYQEQALVELNNILRSLFKKTVLKNKSHDDIFNLFKIWQQNQHKIRSMQTDKKNLTWPKLFANQDFVEIPKEIIGETGYKIVVRNSSDELFDESKKMKHCAATFANLCYKGNYHLLSIVDENDNSLSTILVGFDYSSKTIIDLQHSAFNNRVPPLQNKYAIDWLFREIKNGKIAVDFDFLSKNLQQRVKFSQTLQGAAHNLIGFDPFNQSIWSRAKSHSNQIFDRTCLGEELREFSATKTINLQGLAINGNSVINILSRKKRSPINKSHQRSSNTNNNKKTLCKNYNLSTIFSILARISGTDAHSNSAPIFKPPKR